MNTKIILTSVVAMFFTLSQATELIPKDDNSEVVIKDLEAELSFLKLENTKLKKEVGTSTSVGKGGKKGNFWYVGASIGYGIPFLTTNKKSPMKEIGDGVWEQSPGKVSRTSQFGTNGGGFAINANWGYMFNKYIGIDVLHTVAWHPESLDAKMDVKAESFLGKTSYFASQKTATMAIYLSPHLVMRWNNEKRFGIFAKVGGVVPLHGITVSRAKIDDNSGRTLQTLSGVPPILGIPFIHMKIDAVAKTKYQPTVGVSASMGMDVKLSDRVWLYGEVRVQAYTIKLIETVMTEFKMSTDLKLGDLVIPTTIADDLIKGISGGLLSLASLTGGMPLNVNSAAEAPKFLTHYRYVDKITEESNTARYGAKSLTAGLLNFTGLDAVDLNKPMDEPGIKFNTSTLYFNIGLRINVGKK